MIRAAHAALNEFAASIFEAAGSSSFEAERVATHLTEANLLGHDSHGVMRVPIYCEWLRAGKVSLNRRARRVFDRGPLLGFDGEFGFGQVIGHDAMEAAAARAREEGVAVVAIRNSGHLGRIGAYAEQLARAGMVSLHFVNSSGGGIMVAPHGGRERRLSANPLAAAAPGPDGRPIVLDMATGAIAEGSLMLAIDRGEKLAPGLILDGAGRPTTEPSDFYGDPAAGTKPGAILPFGGHKGFGLSLFCEILAGALSGGGSGHPGNPTAGRFVNNMLSIVIAPASLEPASGYGDDVSRLAAWIRSTRPSVEGKDVLLPGENGERTKAERLVTGIPLASVTCRKLAETARRLDVAPPGFLLAAERRMETPARS
ncbi:MAG TPA: Ldh family oxidoreductase [Acetobacteraceae bacterium]|nr:Ldh family oxidoreductase [Acetobacteraceae bacterium]